MTFPQNLHSIVTWRGERRKRNIRSVKPSSLKRVPEGRVMPAKVRREDLEGKSEYAPHQFVKRREF